MLLSREGETLLTQIPILQEGEHSDQRSLYHRLLVKRYEGSLLNGINFADDLPQVITRWSRVDGWFGTLLLNQDTIEILLKRCEHFPLRFHCGQI